MDHFAGVIVPQCPLYPQKRTSELSRQMSALWQKQTYAMQQTAPFSITPFMPTTQ